MKRKCRKERKNERKNEERKKSDEEHIYNRDRGVCKYTDRQTDTLTGKSNENIEGEGKERQNSKTYKGDLINENAKKQIKKTIGKKKERSQNEIVK